MLKIHLATLFLAIGLSAPAWAVDGVMLRDDTLRATASASAAALGLAGKGGKVAILARQGGWTQVRAAGKTGWVRLLSVRASTPSAASLAEMAALTAQRDPNKVVATSGLRGLGEEELRKAQYDAQEMQLLEAQAVTADETRRFAAEASLAAVKLGHLPAPQAQATPASSTGGFGF
jgi:hypothetical protein